MKTCINRFLKNHKSIIWIQKLYFQAQYKSYLETYSAFTYHVHAYDNCVLPMNKHLLSFNMNIYNFFFHDHSCLFIMHDHSSFLNDLTSLCYE